MSRQYPRDKMNKTEELRKHLLRYQRIDKATEYAKFKTFSLPDIIMNLKTAKNSLKIRTMKDSKGTYYRLEKDEV